MFKKLLFAAIAAVMSFAAMADKGMTWGAKAEYKYEH